MAYDERLEREAIQDVVTRLVARFTGTRSAEQVEAAVRTAYDRFADSPVRDFIPVLVEHDSKELLRGSKELLRGGTG
ncbi:three-helix bundle dimerization domain-containing protein [Nonomuraea sp. NPDC051941]|uniref:three-helix bundle dimerization domain-containing protein n=1 Tax=Nonomuraea sp. NPDC051941 TaxID=3364373 RepID=UPI0037C582E4